MKSWDPSIKSTSLSSPLKVFKLPRSSLEINSSLAAISSCRWRNSYRSQNYLLERRSRSVPARVVVGEEVRCEEAVVMDEVPLEGEVASVLALGVEEGVGDIREVEVEALRLEDEVRPEGADLGVDEARLGILCGNFASGVRLLCTKSQLWYRAFYKTERRRTRFLFLNHINFIGAFIGT
jgi:hypothetical protein